LGRLNLFSYFFGDRAWTIHFLILTYVGFLLFGLYQKISK
jgi:hypothetical protein